VSTPIRASVAPSIIGKHRAKSRGFGPSLRRNCLAQELPNDADGAFRDRAVGACTGDDTSDEIVHMPLASPALSAG
jgi:hypothetical protein